MLIETYAFTLGTPEIEKNEASKEWKKKGYEESTTDVNAPAKNNIALPWWNH
jgi:hypothetical protein